MAAASDDEEDEDDEDGDEADDDDEHADDDADHDDYDDMENQEDKDEEKHVGAAQAADGASGDDVPSTSKLEVRFVVFLSLTQLFTTSLTSSTYIFRSTQILTEGQDEKRKGRAARLSPR